MKLPARPECEHLFVAGLLWAAHSEDGADLVEWVREVIEPTHLEDRAARSTYQLVLDLEAQGVAALDAVLQNAKGEAFDYALDCMNTITNLRPLDAPPCWVKTYGSACVKHASQQERLRGLESAERAIQRQDHERALAILEDLPAGSTATGYTGHSPDQAAREAELDTGRSVSWGFRRLDEDAGQPRIHDLVLVAARPGVGKTTQATQWSVQLLKQRERVLFVSLEMSAGEIHTKMVQGFAGVTDPSVTPHTHGERDDWDEGVRWLGAQSVRIASGRHVPTQAPAFFQWLREAVHAFQPTVVFIDYLGMLKGEGERQNERVADVSRRARLFARNHSLMLVGVVQLNRAGAIDKNRAPVLSDLKDSSQLEQDGVFIAMLHNPSANAEKDTGERVLFMRKARRGRLTSLRCRLDGATSRLVSQ